VWPGPSRPLCLDLGAGRTAGLGVANRPRLTAPPTRISLGNLHLTVKLAFADEGGMALVTKDRDLRDNHLVPRPPNGRS